MSTSLLSRQSLLIYVILLATTSWQACKTKESMTSDAAVALIPVPVITYEQDTIHLGTMMEGEKRSLKYEFTNTGSKTLIIDLATACRCTALSWPEEPIAPGETGEITVEFDSTGFNGDVLKTIDVIANTEPIVKLAWFTAHIKQK